MTSERSLNCWSRTHTKADSWKTNKRRLRLQIDDIDHDSVRKCFQPWRLGNVQMSFKIRYRVYRPMKEVERIFWIEWIRFSPLLPNLFLWFLLLFEMDERHRISRYGFSCPNGNGTHQGSVWEFERKDLCCSLWLKRFFDRCRWSLCGRVYVGFYTHKKKVTPPQHDRGVVYKKVLPDSVVYIE